MTFASKVEVRLVRFDDSLLHYIKEKKNYKAKTIIEEGDFLNVSDSTGSTLLHYAAKYGNDRLTQYFVQNQWDIEFKNKDLETPLMLAIKNKHTEVISILLKANANINDCNKSGRSILQMFISINPLRDITKLFLRRIQDECADEEALAEKLFDLNFPLPYVMFLENKGITKRMLKLGSLVDTKIDEGITALHIATGEQDLENIDLLVEYGADIMAKDDTLSVPLSFYSFHEAEDPTKAQKILRILAKDKEALTSLNTYGMCALFFAMAYGDRSIIRMILDMNIDLFVIGNTGRSFLFYLAENKNPNVFEELDNVELDVNIRDEYGDTPLHHAVPHGNENAVRFFISRGADLNIQNNNGRTALESAKLFYSICPKKGIAKSIEILRAAMLQ